MTKTFRAHFDGKVIVPDEPVDLPLNQRLIVQVEIEPASIDSKHGTIEHFIRHFEGRGISDSDAQLMRDAIDEASRMEDDPAR